MSKSLGNFFTVKDVLKKWHPLVVRYFLLSAHYRMPIEFSDDLLESARNSLQRLRDFTRRLKNYSAPKGAAGQNRRRIGKARKDFEKAMDDDFDISRGLAAIFDFVRDIHMLLDMNSLFDEDVAACIGLMEDFDKVLGVLDEEKEDDADIRQLIVERDKARAEKNFKLADQIRDSLAKKGVILEDSSVRTRWKRML